MTPLSDTTLAIKTFERPDCLARALASIRKVYPHIPILIADDSRSPQESLSSMDGVSVLPMPFDSGMSAGRNHMVSACQTPFIVLMDDDFIFTEETDLGKLVQTLVDGPYDIAAGHLRLEGGREQHYEGFMVSRDKTLYLFRAEAKGDPIPCEIVLNFFAARIDALRRCQWDEELKICEHEDYFWRAKGAGIRVAYTPGVWAWHQREKPGEYGKYRNLRIRDMRGRAMEKHGWTDMVWMSI